ncbi:DUF1932 domain-containing protein [Amycolatopsis sp. A133]|uniref:DUF1932 domain-containing protein n=1 Tax=Amycolatopsis sp. A133 TaxID=3064472 RepID=UPI0027ED3098|nr:DUF1932 domain-containing protein [Amycolatopsis sp. A133]MDQ7805449.1 DUF1932 domain-containing protein [Amycolatopsis sp. A133]
MTGTIAVLGLGEAGGALARDLAAAGAVVRGYDPAISAAEAAGTGPAAHGTAGRRAEPADEPPAPPRSTTTSPTQPADKPPAPPRSTAAGRTPPANRPPAPPQPATGADLGLAGVIITTSEAEAARGADLILSVNSASAALEALRAGLPTLHPGAVWADLNTASPGTKRQLATLAAEHDVPFADVAIMAPVPGRGLQVPMLATGPAADTAATVLNALGAAVETMPGEAGLAAERKLLRSVFFKGMSAAVVEALQAARAAGCEDWLRKIVVDELTSAGAATVDRLVDGSYRHAVRRTAEMAAAAEMLGELGVRADVAAAARDQLARIADSQDC